MKKKVLAVVLILTMCFIFASCGKDAKESPYVGTWKAINASFAGVEMSVEEVMGGEMLFELKDNGKCTLTLADEKEIIVYSPTEMKWEAKGEAIEEAETKYPALSKLYEACK